MDETEAAPKPKKKKGKLVRLLAVGVVLGGVGGGAFYAAGAGLIPGMGGGHAVDPNRPQLVPRDGVTPSNFAMKGERPAEPGQFKASYYPLKDAFTSNLRGTEGFVQVGLGVSTYYDDRVLQNVALHEMAVRSAVLLTLADQDPVRIATADGKAELKTKLTAAVNDVLKAKAGFGGIDDVYFTSFVMQ
jgi:flagellar FliL protein